MKNTFCFVICFSIAASCTPFVYAQTFEIGGQQAPVSNPPSSKKTSGTSGSAQGPSSANPLGWGSSIEVGRNARAAEESLRRGDGASAALYADRAVKAAPGNARLWFLKGYASRLAMHYGDSLDAYQHGLKLEPGNADGLSGMAQTYARMGRLGDAKNVLMQVIRANPKRQNELLMAGELCIQTNDLQQGVTLLSRAEALHPSSHAEVMMAVAYLKLKNSAKAKELLDEAKRRDPKNPAVFRAVANYFREAHDYKAAIATLKGAPAMNTDVLADLGYSYELNGDNQNSAATYSKAANLAPNQIGLQLNAAQALVRLSEMDEARVFLGRAEKIDANHYRLHALRAQIAKTEDHPQDAIREYQSALQNLPNGAVPEGQLYPIQLRLNLADIYRESGDDASAKQQIAIAEQEVNKLQIEGPARAEFLRVRAAIKTSGNDFGGAAADLQEALKLDPNNLNITLQYANLLWKVNRHSEAQKIYGSILTKDPNNRYGLEAMGYLARETGDNAAAERFFKKLATAYPDDYVAYLALGDLYTSNKDFGRADQSYQQSFKLAPTNTVVVANAANAAIEAGHISVAASWVAKASGRMLQDPRLMRERERVAFHEGKFLESAQLGRQVIQQLPRDRNASVYLAYSLYNLGRYDDLIALTNRYSELLPKEPNFPLLAGHVHKQSQLLHEAIEDYSEAVMRDPKIVEGYVNRGYVFNDMQNAEAAIQDFKEALELAPNNGIAHLGLSFSELQLRHGKQALDEAERAEKLMGENGATHLARATAYRQMRLLDKAESEYLLAMKYAPDDVKLRLALADTQYYARRYSEALVTLNDALKLSPDDALIYAKMAHAHAHLHHREQTLQYISAAEREMPDSADVMLATGDALLILGDRVAAVERFTRALEAPGANRVEVRLAFARYFTHERKFEDARQQIALAFAESRVGEASPVTADDFVEAANMFLAMSDFDLAQKYFERAHAAGAADEVVALGMANSYLAQGDPDNAQVQIAALGSPDQYGGNYDYNLAMANIYRQRHDTARAMTSFALANQLSGNDEFVQRTAEDVAGEEGVFVTKNISVNSQFDMNGIFDDTTIYGLDRQIFASANGKLPPPRSSLESRWLTSYRAHLNHWPLISGFFQLRNARGEISLPSESLILDRNTYDYSLNSGVNPVLRMGRATLQFNGGLQMTFRRDKESPFEMNQNLFRQFLYVSTNPIGNWLTVRGEAFHEAGPFTERNLSSRELGARLEFVVGRPWGRTQLITGYSVRDLLFNPLVREFYSTSTWGGVQHEFGQNLQVSIIGEYIRSWRVQDLDVWLAQAMRPAMQFKYQVSNRWSVEGDFSFSRGQGFHDYDNVQSSLLINYVKPIRRVMNDGVTNVPVDYPIRFSFGVQNASYPNFTGHGQTMIRPLIRLTVF